MTYHYGRYWAEITPVRSVTTDTIRYWQYKIYQGERYLFDGHDVDLSSARVSTEAHIDLLIQEDSACMIAA